MAYDEYGNWIEDDYDAIYNNPWMMSELPGTNYSTSKWNFGQELPVGQNVYNQVLTGLKNQNMLLTNPSVAYNAMVATGQPTMDLNALMGLDASGNPYLGGGGGGGGGGDYNPLFTTPYMTSLANSGDPIDQLIYAGIQNGQSPSTIRKAVMESEDGKGLSSDQLYGYTDVIDKAFSEAASAERNDLAGMYQQPQQTPTQEWMARQGLVNPLESYTADSLPGDVVSGADDILADYGQRASNYASARKTAQRDLDNIRAAQERLIGPRLTGRQPSSDTAFVFADPPTHTLGAKQGQVGQQSLLRQLLNPVLDAATTTMKNTRGRTKPELDAQRQGMRKVALAKEREADAVSEGNRLARGARSFAAYDLARQGRTPARDAQRAMLNYLQQTGLG